MVGQTPAKPFPSTHPPGQRKPLPPPPHLGEWGWSSENNCTFTPTARPAWGHLIMVGERNNPMSPSTRDHRHDLMARYTDKGFPDGPAGKECTPNAGDTGDMGWIPGSGRSPGGGNSCLKNSVFLPEKSHDQSSLVGCSPDGYKELHMTEQLSTNTQTKQADTQIPSWHAQSEPTAWASSGGPHTSRTCGLSSSSCPRHSHSFHGHPLVEWKPQPKGKVCSNNMLRFYNF